jgi:two-component system, OmpR family, phosphate regulon sensor histidine kinase PhoR
MNPKFYRLLIWIAIVGLSGLLAVQAFWFYKAYTLQEQQFDEKVNLALREVADEILKENNNATNRISPVKKISENSFFVTIEEPFEYKQLDSVVRNVFASSNITTPFQLALYDTDQTLLFGSVYINGTSNTAPGGACVERDNPKAKMNFAVTFPNKPTGIIGEMNLWIFSAGTFAFILILFGIMVLDLSKQKKLEQIKNDFINNMTHELQTPITNISMASEVLTAKNLSDEKRERYLDIIRQENLRMKHQVNHVLTAATMEKTDFILSKSRVDLNHLLNEVSSNFLVRIEPRGGTVETNLAASNHFIDGDKLQLSNLFFNLLDNAEKYCDTVPHIRISTQDKQNGILVSVEDNGIGINSDSQKMIFEKFYRGSTGNLHDVKGFGLGLTYVKNIVNAHNGIITVTSQVQKGSRFDISFPVSA